MKTDKTSEIRMYPIERGVNQILWAHIMSGEKYNGEEEFENETFKIKPYSWVDEKDNDFHFLHKPSGVMLRWYKYPLRSPECNKKDITHEELYAVLYDCRNSTDLRVQHEVEKWWEKKK